MNLEQPRFSSWRFTSTFFGTAALAGILGVLNLFGDNSAIFSVNYGIPLPYMRFEGFGSMTLVFQAIMENSSFRQFWWQALVYDVVFALLLVSSFAFTIYRWSKAWSYRKHFLFCLASFFAVLPWWLPLELPWTFLRLFGLLVAPLAAITGACHASWMITRWKLGESLAGLGPMGLFVALIVGGYFAAPHDPYRNPQPADLPLLLRTMKSEDARVRQLSLRAIARLAKQGHSSVDVIIAALDDTDKVNRHEAVSMIHELGPKAAAAVPKLIPLLDDERQNYLVAAALTRIGPAAREAVPILEERLKMSAGYMKQNCADALWAIDKNTVLVVPAMIEMLNDDFDPLRVDAANLLGQIGPAAKDAVPTLIEMVNYEPPPAPPRPPVAVAPNRSGVPSPRPGEMPEAEFYPRIRDAAQRALERIQPGMARKRVEP